MEIKLRVSPNAVQTIIGLYGDDAIRLRIVSPPTDGEANSEVEIVRGVKSHSKIVSVEGIGREEAECILSGQIR